MTVATGQWIYIYLLRVLSVNLFNTSVNAGHKQKLITLSVY